MELEIFSDMVCPWCLLGKRRLEFALADYPYADQIGIRWRSFQLRPDDNTEATRTIPETMAEWSSGPDEVAERLGQLTRLAAEAGLEYHLETARPVNTFDAHRLAHLARAEGVGPAVLDALMTGYTRDNLILTDHAALLRLATANGLDAERVAEVLAGDAYAEDVRADLRRARELGIGGVPTFVVDGVAAVSGAQPEPVLHALFERARTGGDRSTSNIPHASPDGS